MYLLTIMGKPIILSSDSELLKQKTKNHLLETNVDFYDIEWYHNTNSESINGEIVSDETYFDKYGKEHHYSVGHTNIIKLSVI